jgi:hypothetical protein
VAAVRVEYNYFESGEQKAQAEEAFLGCWGLLPFWAQVVYVCRYHGRPDDSAAIVHCKPEYRGLRIELYDAFFDCERYDRALRMRHEVIHALLAPMTNFVFQAVLDLFKETNPQLHTVLHAEFTARMEAVVQDLALSLENKPQETTQ